MNNAVRPKIRKQIHPDVLALLAKHDAGNPVPLEAEPNFDDQGTPLWMGPSAAFWDSLVSSRHDLDALVAICQEDFPTFCAVLVKIRIKRIGRIGPLLFNRGQVRLWMIIAKLVAELRVLFVAILKARQFGISTFVTAWDYWQAWRLQDAACVLVGDTDKLVKEFVDRIAVIHDELPDIEYFKPELRAQNRKGRVPKSQVEYMDRRTKILTMVDKEVSVGLVGQHFLLSEIARYKDPAGLLEDLEPMLPARGSQARLQCSVFLETTPRGKGPFYDLWQLAKSGESEWVAFFLPWFVMEDEYSVDPPPGWKPDPDMREFRRRCTHERMKLEGREVTLAQIYWYDQELANKDFDQDKMDRQYPTDDETCFLLGNDSVFSSELRYLKRCVQDAESELAEKWKARDVTIPKGPRGYPVVWRGEVVRGDPSDPEKILDVPNPFDPHAARRFNPRWLPYMDRHGKVVKGALANKGRLSVWAPPVPGRVYVAGIDASGGVGADNGVISVIDASTGEQAAEFVDNTCGPEYLADEACAIGYWYNTALLNPEINSIGVVVMKRLKQVWNYPKVAHEEKWDEPGLRKAKFGTYMNEDMKRLVIANLRYFMREQYLRIASDALLSECSTFEKDLGDDGNDTYKAAQGCRDDRVLAVGLACLAIRQSPKLYGYVKPKHPLPSADALGLNDSPQNEEPSGNKQQEDAVHLLAQQLPKVLQEIMDGRNEETLVADPMGGDW